MGGLFHNLRHPRRCYLICAIARSGSNLLTDGLHATRRAGRPKQFFLPKFEAEYRAKHGFSERGNFAGYVRGIIQATATSNEVFGFKVMGWYLEGFLARLRQTDDFGRPGGGDVDLLQAAFPRLKFVHIVRRDNVRQAVSKARATLSGHWKVKDGDGADSPPEFDADLITRCLEDGRRDHTAWSRFFERNKLPRHVVEYESLCQNYEGTLQEVLEYLKIRLPRGQKIPPVQTTRQSDALSAEWERRFLALPTAPTN